MLTRSIQRPHSTLTGIGFQMAALAPALVPLNDIATQSIQTLNRKCGARENGMRRVPGISQRKLLTIEMQP